MHCHVDHSVYELFDKRHFRCDCGTPQTRCNCALTPSSSDSGKKMQDNSDNKYNHNFDGLYCWCNKVYQPPLYIYIYIYIVCRSVINILLFLFSPQSLMTTAAMWSCSCALFVRTGITKSASSKWMGLCQQRKNLMTSFAKTALPNIHSSFITIPNLGPFLQILRPLPWPCHMTLQLCHWHMVC